jgi:hypothetical protein
MQNKEKILSIIHLVSIAFLGTKSEGGLTQIFWRTHYLHANNIPKSTFQALCVHIRAANYTV